MKLVDIPTIWAQIDSFMSHIFALVLSLPALRALFHPILIHPFLVNVRKEI